MKREWGCTYFKLDANFWGAIHGGRFHDPRATRIEAYRRGMQAILRGVENSFVLGCNHPIWPSLGLIHGSRSSNDIKRTWERIETTARQNLSRNWQNGRLVVERFRRDRADRRSAGQRVSVSCDCDLRVRRDAFVGRRSHEDQCREARRCCASCNRRQALPRVLTTIHFAWEEFGCGKREVVAVLNWNDAPQDVSIRLKRRCRITDFWSDAALGTHSGDV